MLTVHHLGRGSGRVVWLCEELVLGYTLVRHQRDPQTLLSPPALKALHPRGAAPVIEDDGVLLAGSVAVVETVPRRSSVRLSDDLAEMDGFASLAMTIDWRQL